MTGVILQGDILRRMFLPSADVSALIG